MLINKAVRLLKSLALLALPLLAQLPAQAQAVADTASYTLNKVAFQNFGGTVLRAGKQTFLVEALHPNRDSTRLQQVWLDERLHLRRRAVLALKGKNLRPEAIVASGSGVLLQLASRDTLRLLALDTLGRQVAEARQPLPPARGQYDVRLLELPQLPGVLLLEQWRNGSVVLIYRNADLTLRWQQPLALKGKLTKLVADGTHLWLMLTTYHGARHPTSTALCLNVATGTELSRTQVGLTADKNQRVPSAIGLGRGHSLLVAGHAYRGRAVNTHHSGDLFLLELSPDGQVLRNVQLPFRQVPRQLGGRSRRVAWQVLQAEADGSVRLVGETYTTTPAMASWTRSTLSLGLLGFDVLRPKDLVSLRLTPGGQAEQVRVLPLRLDRGSFVWPGYASPLAMEQLASEANGFRTRGLAADSTTLVLRSPQRVQAFDLRSGQVRELCLAPEQGRAEVLYVGPTFVLLAEGRPFRSSIRLLRVGYPFAH